MVDLSMNVLSDEIVISKIYIIRGQRVMLNRDLAALYCVETIRLNEQVKRNMNRFLEYFMFQLSQAEVNSLRSQIATSSWGGRRSLPFVFTEHGVLMLPSVLNCSTAIKINIQIMRIYTKIRIILATNKELLIKYEQLQEKLAEHDNKNIQILEYIKQFEETQQELIEFKVRPKIGFRPS